MADGAMRPARPRAASPPLRSPAFWESCAEVKKSTRRNEESHAISNAEEKTQFRRNGKWFKDFVNRNDPRDVISMEVEAEDDAYREKTYSLICKKYKR